jgi:hypothetical protein
VACQAEACPQCGYPIGAAVLEKDKGASRLEAAAKGMSTWKRKNRRYYDIFIDASEKTLVGSILIGMFQQNLLACAAAFVLFGLSLLLLWRSPD